MHDFYLQLIFLPFFGFLMGILSMLYGIGGGVIVIPVIYLFLRQLGLDSSMAMQISVGTSMLNVLGSTVSASYKHYRVGNTIWEIVRRIAPFIVLGSLIGAVAIHFFSGEWLHRFFIVFLIFILVHSLFSHNFKQSWKMRDYRSPSLLSVAVAGTGIGLISVLVGIGGGTMILPYLRHHRLPMLQTTAISATLTPILALVGSIGFFTVHLPGTYAPPYTLGAINLPIFLCIFIGSWIGVQFGNVMNQRFSEEWRARSFPILIAVILALMLV